MIGLYRAPSIKDDEMVESCAAIDSRYLGICRSEGMFWWRVFDRSTRHRLLLSVMYTGEWTEAKRDQIVQVGESLGLTPQCLVRTNPQT